MYEQTVKIKRFAAKLHKTGHERFEDAEDRNAKKPRLLLARAELC
jgi:hypothetical protein